MSSVSLRVGTAITAAAALALSAAGAARAAEDPVLPTGVVYVTNAGSGDVSSLAIGPGGALTPLEAPVKTLGETPRGIALTPDGATAYVVNSDSSTLSVFRVGARGALVPNPLVLPTGHEPWGATVAPNGRTLYVTNTADATVSAYPIRADGTPGRPSVTPATSDNPKQTVLSPDGRFLYLAYADVDEDTDSPARVVTRFPVRADGSLGAGQDVAKVGRANFGIAISPDGGLVYVSSLVDQNIWGFRRGADGSLTPVPQAPVFVPDPNGLKFTPDGRHLYVAGSTPDSGTPPGGVFGFTVGADGTLTPAAGSPGPTPDDAEVAAVAVTPDGQNVFAAIRDTSQVSAFRIGSGGALKQVAGSPFDTGGKLPLNQSIVVRPVPVSGTQP